MHLSVRARRRFYIYREMGLSIREIALKLSRHRSAVNHYKWRISVDDV
ncbi:hypothetical protein ACQUW5_04285 [Legionella sp. CNM-1927-20]